MRISFFLSFFFLQDFQLPAAQQLGKLPTKQSHSKQFIQQKAALQDSKYKIETAP